MTLTIDNPATAGADDNEPAGCIADRLTIRYESRSTDGKCLTVHHNFARCARNGSRGDGQTSCSEQAWTRELLKKLRAASIDHDQTTRTIADCLAVDHLCWSALRERCAIDDQSVGIAEDRSRCHCRASSCKGFSCLDLLERLSAGSVDDDWANGSLADSLAVYHRGRAALTECLPIDDDARSSWCAGSCDRHAACCEGDLAA